jgi:hypothetical protein
MTDILKTDILKTDPSPSLNQGKKFKLYQNNIDNSLEKNEQEGFTTNDNNLIKKTMNVINNNSFNDLNAINSLKNEYQKTLTEYNNLVEQISGNLNNYVDRTSSNNPYLNKTIRFTTGQICYVTKQGVVKWIPSQEIWDSVNAPKNYINVNIPWNNSYSTPGTQIPTTPPLISGTEVVNGQNLGNEGSNVFVNDFLPTGTTASYMGCFATSSKNDNMKFIGGSPPSLDVTIPNGTFSQPVLSNNTFQYITSSSQVPGWYFNGSALLNNSTAWGYPIPYPNGNQCVSIQNKSYIYCILNLNTGVNYNLSLYGCGRNCCSGSLTNEISIQLYTNENAFISNVYSFTPPVSKWTNYSTTFTVPKTGIYRLYFNGTNTNGDQSSAIQNISLNNTASSTGNYTYNDCMKSAIEQGYQYFALQNVNSNTSQGYCAVSNSEPAITKYGTSNIPNKMVALWSSNTANQPGNTATLSATGSLQVVNSSGQVVYSTPGSSALPSNYLGCYGDSSTRAMTLYNNGKQQYNLAQCQNIANTNGYQYFGLQNSTSGQNAQCTLSNNLSQALEYGTATNCSKISDGSWSGGGWSNAVYNAKSPQSNYFLTLQDDGNMVIYRGTGPNDNQGTIWAAATNGKQQSANSSMVSTKGKYGKTWISNGQTLAAGDFIGSTNGNLALIMQADGNLVLYTYQMAQNCIKMKDGNTGGGVGANAAYNISKKAVQNNMGKLGYIDSDSQLYTYPSNNQSFTNGYKKIQGIDTLGNDIPGSALNNTTLQNCESACNSNANCAGFVASADGTQCWPKTSNMYPFGGPSNINSSKNIYIRSRIPKQPPLGVSQNTINTDTLSFQNYINKGDIGNKYGLANINDVQKQQLEQLQIKMNVLSNQITNLTNKFETGTTSAENQSRDNALGIGNYETNLLDTNETILYTAGETSGNIENVLKDSNIVVLQKNYSYLVWSILAAGTVLISMNVINK